MEELIRSVIKYDNILESFVREVSRRPSTLEEMKHYTKYVGDIWEMFCASYLRELYGYTVYTLQACPTELLNELGLSKRDVGIDLIAVYNEKKIAVQCKFRKTYKSLSWREVATFDALCMRTGPWSSCMVMTTAQGLRREGKARSEDVFIGKTRLSKLTRHDWHRIGKLGDGHTCGGATTSFTQDMRDIRLRRFAHQCFSLP